MPAARTSSSTSLPAKTDAVWIEDGLFSACPIGIDLLRQFAQARPNDYAFLQTKDFLDVGTSGFIGIPEWDVFAAHSDRCDQCKA